MAPKRSVLSLILVILTTFLISCGGPTVASAPPTYTQAQLAKIQEYIPDIVAVRDRSEELDQVISKKDWINLGNFIHGPMTEAKLNMTYITPNLLPKDQPTARKITRDLFDHLVKIGQAAALGNSQSAYSNSKAAFGDLDEFLKLLPQKSTQVES